MLLIKVLNKRHAAKRVAMGKSEHIVDLSMAEGKGLGSGENAAAQQQSEDAHAATGDGAFDDVTDIRNEDFVYVY